MGKITVFCIMIVILLFSACSVNKDLTTGQIEESIVAPTENDPIISSGPVKDQNEAKSIEQKFYLKDLFVILNKAYLSKVAKPLDPIKAEGLGETYDPNNTGAFQDKQFTIDKEKSNKIYNYYSNRDMNYAVYSIKNFEDQIQTYSTFFEFVELFNDTNTQQKIKEGMDSAQVKKLDFELTHEIKSIDEIESRAIEETFYMVYSGGKSIDKTTVDTTIYYLCSPSAIVKIKPRLGLKIETKYLVDKDLVYRNLEEQKNQLIGQENNVIRILGNECPKAESFKETFKPTIKKERLFNEHLPENENKIEFKYLKQSIGIEPAQDGRDYYIEQLYLDISNLDRELPNVYVEVIITADDNYLTYNKTEHLGVFKKGDYFDKRLSGIDINFANYLVIKTTVYSIINNKKEVYAIDEKIIDAP